MIDSDVLLIKFDPKKKIALKDVTEARDYRKKMIGDIPYYPIIDFTQGLSSFTAEAKSWAAVNKESTDLRIMDILVVNNWTTKIEARLYKSLFKPRTETIIVKSIEEAMELVGKRKAELADSGVLAG